MSTSVAQLLRMLLISISFTVALPSVQDPVVFSGTVRDNLDPFGSSQGDNPLWAALRQTGMTDTISELVNAVLCCAALRCLCCHSKELVVPCFCVHGRALSHSLYIKPTDRYRLRLTCTCKNATQTMCVMETC